MHAFPRRCEQAGRHILARLSNLHQGIGTEQVHGNVYEIGGEREGVDVGKKREQREEQRGLVEDAAVVGRNIVGVEIQTLLHCRVSALHMAT